jgi:hypothetical protein
MRVVMSGSLFWRNISLFDWLRFSRLRRFFGFSTGNSGRNCRFTRVDRFFSRLRRSGLRHRLSIGFFISGHRGFSGFRPRHGGFYCGFTRIDRRFGIGCRRFNLRGFFGFRARNGGFNRRLTRIAHLTGRRFGF